MGVQHLCKCDSCNSTKDMQPTAGGQLTLPNGWYAFNVLHKDTDGNKQYEFTYCEKCGKSKQTGLRSNLIAV